MYEKSYLVGTRGRWRLFFGKAHNCRRSCRSRSKQRADIVDLPCHPSFAPLVAFPWRNGRDKWRNCLHLGRQTRLRHQWSVPPKCLSSTRETHTWHWRPWCPVAQVAEAVQSFPYATFRIRPDSNTNDWHKWNLSWAPCASSPSLGLLWTAKRQYINISYANNLLPKATMITQRLRLKHLSIRSSKGGWANACRLGMCLGNQNKNICRWLTSQTRPHSHQLWILM